MVIEIKNIKMNLETKEVELIGIDEDGQEIVLDTFEMNKNMDFVDSKGVLMEEYAIGDEYEN